MRIVKDKATGKYKIANTEDLFDTKEQAQRVGLDRLAERLAHVRKKYTESILGYGK